jgi:hypothetical protein
LLPQQVAAAAAAALLVVLAANWLAALMSGGKSMAGLPLKKLSGLRLNPVVSHGITCVWLFGCD